MRWLTGNGGPSNKYGTADSLATFGAKKALEKTGVLVAKSSAPVAEAKPAESKEDAAWSCENLVATGSPVFRAVLDQAVRRAR